MTPARKLTHNMKFECFWMQKDTNFGNIINIHHFGPKNPQNPTQKDTNFRNTIIIRHFRPENPQNLTQKDRNFEKMHSLASAKKKMPTNKESIHFSRISHFSHHDSNALINPIQYQPTNHFWEHLVTHFFEFCRPIVIYSDSSTLAQDAVLNCYKRPVHYHYQLSYFFQKTNPILCSILAQIHSGC